MDPGPFADHPLDLTDLCRALVRIVNSLHASGSLGDRLVTIELLGGAASGKTTVTKALVEYLRKDLHSGADWLGTDDYVVGDRDLRRATLEGGDPWKKYDFELLNAKVEQIARLAPGESVRVPAYDEATGVAVAAGEVGYPRTIDRVGVLVVEGDFPALVNPCLSIFLDVSDADRLANRVDRDARARNGSDPTAVIENFKLRQALQHIPITLPARQRCAWVIEAIIVDGHWCYSLATVGNYAG